MSVTCWGCSEKYRLIERVSQELSGNEVATHMANNEKVGFHSTLPIGQMPIRGQCEVHSAVVASEIWGLVEVNDRRVGCVEDRRNAMIGLGGFIGHSSTSVIQWMEPGA